MTLQDRIRKIAPYVPGEQPQDRDIIKLNTNECPYPPSPRFAEAYSSLSPADFRRYPDTEAHELVQAISDIYGIPVEQIFVGVGSDEVLAFAFQAFFTGGGRLLFPDITYSFYPVWAELYHIPFTAVPTDQDFRIRAEDYLGVDDACGVIFPNPNAPTGIAEPRSFVERILAGNPDKVVIVDEAYVDFGGETALPLLEKYENLMVIRTCSKSRAMAGLRIGYAFGSRQLIDAVKAIKFSFNSYTLNHASIIPGAAAIRDTVYFDEICSRIIKTRERMAQGLKKLGFVFPPSSANFIFAKHERIPGREIQEKLREKKIYVRRWNAPRISDYMRITVGTDEETDRLLEELGRITAC